MKFFFTNFEKGERLAAKFPQKKKKSAAGGKGAQKAPVAADKIFFYSLSKKVLYIIFLSKLGFSAKCIFSCIEVD